ncbi:MAG TPA: DUF3866 family protein [Acidimicrobiales bacterium]|nr:DUF3866 family protein [Acidimicrobiales bacterium]
MSRFLTATVEEITDSRDGIQRVLAGGRKAYVLTQLIGSVGVGDEVVLNVTATDLQLGTGGWDVVHWNLSRRDWHEPGGGHVMKLRYTSLQADVGVTEEAAELDTPLVGLPVVACFLHSQIAAVALAFAEEAPGRRLGYVMTDSAALPLALSDLVADLRDSELLHTTVTVGHAFGGDLEAVNLISGLAVARSAGCVAVIVGPGPGVVGTATPTGFSGIEVASIIDSVAAVKARPVVAVRWSGADPRSRHQGVSHHVSTVLQLAHAGAWVACPVEYELGELPVHHQRAVVAIPDISEGLTRLGVTTMGRSPEEDRGFFEMSSAAGVVAARMLDS